jgi:hypothetical protein
LRHWHTADGNEVDFVVNTAYDEGFAIEAKYNIEEFKPTKYKKFCEHYPKFPLECKAYVAPKNEGSLLAM